MYRTLLEQIRQRKAQFGETMQPLSTSHELAKLRRDVRNKLAVDLPEEYLSFLSITNGLVWNGLYVFASERNLIAGRDDVWIYGVIDRNIEERALDDRMCGYLVFAEDGEVSFAFNIPESRYEVVSRVARYVDDTFDSFDKLLERAFQNHL